jgi:hypothetical protein
MESLLRSSIDRWTEHIRALAAEIGPRGSTTGAEQEAAQYCQHQLAQIGLEPKIETYRSARSIFHPHLLASVILLIAYGIYPLAGRVGAGFAAFLSLLAFVSELLELSFIENPLRWLVSKGPSQNVVAIIPPKGKHQQDVILIGHIDTQRTPLIFKTPGWVKAYQSFTTVAFILFLVQVILFTLGAITQFSGIWLASIPSALCALLLMLICIQADRTPFSHGANDNATGAGLVLTLAEDLKNKSLDHTCIWLVCSGCEEVQHYGAINFFRRHRHEFRNPKAIIFEMLGCDGPAWLTKEGIIIPFHADRNLVSLTARLAGEHPHWGAYPTRITGGNTEMADALRAKIPAITITGMGPHGEMPFWHQKGDTFDKIKPEVMARAYSLTWSLINALDHQAISQESK